MKRYLFILSFVLLACMVHAEVFKLQATSFALRSKMTMADEWNGQIGTILPY